MVRPPLALLAPLVASAASERLDDVEEEDPLTLPRARPQTNQLAIRTHLTQPPHSIILDARSHVHLYEAGGVAMHSQASSHAVPPRNGHHLTLEEVLDNAVFGEDIHSAPTKLVSLENTLSGSASASLSLRPAPVALRPVQVVDPDPGLTLGPPSRSQWCSRRRRSSASRTACARTASSCTATARACGRSPPRRACRSRSCAARSTRSRCACPRASARPSAASSSARASSSRRSSGSARRLAAASGSAARSPSRPTTASTTTSPSSRRRTTCARTSPRASPRTALSSSSPSVRPSPLSLPRLAR